MTDSADSRESIETIIRYAKISSSSLKGEIQRIIFAEDAYLPAYKLVEINDELLTYLEAGNKLYIRGETVDSAVICTDRQTYNVREAEISNSLIVLPGCSIDSNYVSLDLSPVDRKAVCSTHTYWELKQIQRFSSKKLITLLSNTLYKGSENEASSVSSLKMFKLQDLKEVLPASEMEIEVAIKKLPICDIDGFLRLLDFEYLVKITNQILNFADENSWSWQELEPQHTYNELSTLLLPEVMRKWFSMFTDATEKENIRQLKPDQLCRLYADVILRSVDKMYLQDFLETWQNSIPDGMLVDLKFLSGLAIVDTDARCSYIKRLDVESLPDEPSKRFDVLFSNKQQWDREEILPFIENIAMDMKDVDGLLLKHVRCVLSNDKKLYTRK